MLIGFALFSTLRQQYECIEVFPHAIVRRLGVSGARKSTARGSREQLEAVVDAAAAAPRAALDDLFTARQPDIDGFVARLEQIDADGAVVVINGEIVGLDLVDHRTTS